MLFRHRLEFQSTQPKRAATLVLKQKYTLLKSFQSTQPKRAATRDARANVEKLLISIHAAQEGCDTMFNPQILMQIIFQSTQPKRAATAAHWRTLTLMFYFNPRSPRGLRPKCWKICRLCCYFNPRSPRGLRRSEVHGGEVSKNISIHAAQEGCDGHHQ